MVKSMAEDTPPPIPTDSPRPSGCGRLLVLALLGGLLITGIVTWKFMDLVKDGLAWMSQGLVTQDINETFRQSVTRIVSTNGDILEVATLETDETVTKYDVKTLFNQTVYLGTTVSEIRTPVVYRYHIQLSDGWNLRVENGQCIVNAPALRPSQPPAIRTERMEKKSESGWLRFNAAESLATLEKNLTPTLEKRAGNRSHLNLIRESARKSVAEFVKKWLLTQKAAPLEEIQSITVIFPDEVAPSGQPRTLPPTLQVP